MKNRELANILIAVLLLFVVSSLSFILEGDSISTMQILIFSFVVIAIPVIVRKAIAYSLDTNVEHRIWHVYHYGLRPSMHFKKEIPFGAIIPLFFSLISLGIVKLMTFVTYEARALKHRAAKRFGFYSYAEITDWHNGLIGASGIVSLLLISLISYFPGWEYLSKMAAYYAFWNMLPVSNLDGTQIFFGNRILWTILFVLSLVFSLYAIAF